MTHMYFSAGTEGRISYGHLGRTSLFMPRPFDVDRPNLAWYRQARTIIYVYRRVVYYLVFLYKR